MRLIDIRYIIIFFLFFKVTNLLNISLPLAFNELLTLKFILDLKNYEE